MPLTSFHCTVCTVRLDALLTRLCVRAASNNKPEIEAYSADPERDIESRREKTAASSHDEKEAAGDNHAPTFNVAILNQDYEGKPTEHELATLRRVPGRVPVVAYFLCAIEFCERASYYGEQASTRREFDSIFHARRRGGGEGECRIFWR